MRLSSVAFANLGIRVYISTVAASYGSAPRKSEKNRVIQTETQCRFAKAVLLNGRILTLKIALRLNHDSGASDGGRTEAVYGVGVMRTVCRFSCGAASAVATKLILAECPAEDVLIVNAYIQQEHEDNRRFLADCEKWFGRPIVDASDEKYGASTDEVWLRKRFMVSHLGAPCSSALKREPLGRVAEPGDIVVVGMTADQRERDRFANLCERFPQESFRAPLIEHGLSKEDCLAMIERAGIQLPAMYRLGYDNANCIGCPKGGQAYWQNIRADFPERFVQIQGIQEAIGPGASFLRFRSGPRKNERMSLAELPEGRGDMKKEPNFSCSFFCQLAEQEINPD